MRIGKAPYKSGHWIAGLIDKSARLRADTSHVYETDSTGLHLLARAADF